MSAGGAGPLVLGAAEVASALTAREVVATVQKAIIDAHRGRVVAPARLIVDLPGMGRHYTVMPAYLSEAGVLGAKLLVVDHADHSRYPSVVILHDVDARVLAVVDGGVITAMRTGAAAAVAARALAPPPPWTVGIIGAGVQAEWQLRALAVVGDIRRIRAYARRGERLADFCARLSAQLRVAVEPASTTASALEGADVVVTATTSADPVLRFAELAPGVHINAVGSFGIEARELDDDTIRSARIVVNDVEASFRESGELAIPLRRGVLRREQVCATLGEVLCGDKPGRTSVTDVTLYKLVGASHLDVPLAHAAYAATAGAQSAASAR
jgi:ornithine cyclodeaminase/alanine dehydrogenase-like protein (mu-crystallin family)